MARLRGPQGCPWDREQTLESLRAFLLEETHEVLDAIDRGDSDALRGEIGDLLFEGVFLAQVAADQGQFTVTDSLRAIAAKLIRRHPHIFDPERPSARDTDRGASTVGADQGEGASRRRRAPLRTARPVHVAALAAARLRNRHACRRGRLRLGDAAKS